MEIQQDTDSKLPAPPAYNSVVFALKEFPLLNFWMLKSAMAKSSTSSGGSARDGLGNLNFAGGLNYLIGSFCAWRREGGAILFLKVRFGVSLRGWFGHVGVTLEGQRIVQIGGLKR